MKTFACDVNALLSKELKEAADQSAELFNSTIEVVEFPDGYSIKFKDSPELINQLAKMMTVNRYCCPFLNQELIAEPYQGAVGIQLTGEEGVKELIARDLSTLLPSELAYKYGLLK